MNRSAGRPFAHRRIRVRLEGYDYHQPRLYFITVCTEHRLPLLGEVVDGCMRLSHVGHMVGKVWSALPHTFAGIALDAMVIMPDHLHGIVTLGWDPDASTDPSLGEVVKYFKGRTATQYFAGVREQGWPPVPG